MSLRRTIVSQFENPRGMLGRVAGWILASRGSNLARNHWTVGLVDPARGEIVLEAGCGPGVALELCLQREGVKAVGIDHSPLMIAQSGKRNRRALEAGRLTLIPGTIESLPANLGPFDKAFSINVIQFVDHPSFVSAMAHRLKPGGLLATTCQPRHPKATRGNARRLADKLADIMAAQGFTSLRIEELDLKPVPAICVLGRRSAGE